MEEGGLVGWTYVEGALVAVAGAAVDTGEAWMVCVVSIDDVL